MAKAQLSAQAESMSAQDGMGRGILRTNQMDGLKQPGGWFHSIFDLRFLTNFDYKMINLTKL